VQTLPELGSVRAFAGARPAGESGVQCPFSRPRSGQRPSIGGVSRDFSRSRWREQRREQQQLARGAGGLANDGRNRFRVVEPRRRMRDSPWARWLAAVTALLFTLLSAAGSAKPLQLDNMDFPSVAAQTALTGIPVHYRGEDNPQALG